MSKGKEFSETSMGGWGSVIWILYEVQLRGFPSWLPDVPSSSISLWTESNLVCSRARMQATAQSLCSVLKSSPLQTGRVKNHVLSLIRGMEQWKPHVHKQANRQTNENSGTDSSVLVTRGKGGGLVVNGKGGQINGEGRRFKLCGGNLGVAHSAICRLYRTVHLKPV